MLNIQTSALFIFYLFHCSYFRMSYSPYPIFPINKAHSFYFISASFIQLFTKIMCPCDCFKATKYKTHFYNVSFIIIEL